MTGGGGGPVGAVVLAAFFAAFALFRRALACCSPGNSLVEYASQVEDAKDRMLWPRRCVAVRREAKVESVCIRSFAMPCQKAKLNNKSRTNLLCGSGSKFSNTGIAH